jgi:hypothetical protein
MKLRLVIAALAAAAGACADLPEVAETGCGNLVLEADEDCDGFSAFGEQTACGAPDTANACFYVCDEAAEIVCPEGWGCGRDGRCRQPGGVLSPAPGSPWRFRVDDFAIGDVDGDGLSDLVGNDLSGITVRFGADEGSFSASLDVSIRQPKGPVTYGYFDEDGLLDVVVPIDGGLFVMLGRPDKTLDPFPYSPFEIEQSGSLRFLPLQAQQNLVSETVVLLEGAMQFLQSTAPPKALPPTQLVSRIAGRIPVANLDDDAQGRDEFALAFQGASQVWIYTSEGASGPGPSTLAVADYQIVDVPGQVQRGALFADVDGDGSIDLLVSVNIAGTPHVAVALNDGTGQLSSPAEVAPVFSQGVHRGWPLAAGDFTGNGMADYVLPGAVVVSARVDPLSPPGPDTLIPTAFATVEDWAEAVVGDFNRDGTLDVATVVEGLDGVEFFLNNGDGLFNRFPIDTPDPPVALRVGDFDGDFVDDVAFAGAGFGGKPDVLSVIFGAASGGPSEPVPMGTFGFIEGLEPLSSVLTLEGVDVTTDMMVLSSSFPARDRRAVAILQGSSSRRMLSPFFLDSGAGSFDVALAAVIGTFVPDGIRDLVAISQVSRSLDTDVGPDSKNLWLIPGKGGAGDLDAAAADHLTLPSPETFHAACAVWAAGDLDGSGTDEIVAIDNGGPCFGGGFSPRPRLLVASVDAEAEGNPFAVDVDEMPGSYTVVRDVILHDLDGDGDLDLLALFVGEHRRSGPVDNAAVVVVWNIDGALSLSNVTVLQVTDAERLFDVAPIRLVDSTVPDVAILAKGAIYTSRMDLETRTFGPPTRLLSQQGDGRLEVGDLNGDGLDDIAFTVGSDVHVLLQEPQPPLGGATTVLGPPEEGDDQ